MVESSPIVEWFFIQAHDFNTQEKVHDLALFQFDDLIKGLFVRNIYGSNSKGLSFLSTFT